MYSPPKNKKPVMKAKHLHQVPEKKKMWPVIGDEKYDGVYAYIVLQCEHYRVYSRTGMVYHSLDHLSEQAAKFHKGKADVVLIVEIHHGTYPVNKISGYCRDKKAQHPELLARVHDLIPYDDFVAGKCMINYATRRRMLTEYLPTQYNSQQVSKSFFFTKQFILNSEQDAKRKFKEITDQGGEGIIGRNPDGIWIGGHRKNEDYWKMKIELSFDLRVTGVESGRPGTKYEHTLGKIRCKFKAFGKPDGEELVVKASGMTDAMRDLWWANKLNRSDELLDGMPIDIIDCIVKIDAMTYTITGLLREPRYKEVRFDKEEADL